jgi:predicted AlkP superfamily phosphohydrolase/phosphomutase
MLQKLSPTPTPAPTGHRKVLLVGWDAADWKVIHPLLDAGKMPNLARFLELGMMSNIATLQPALSPTLCMTNLQTFSQSLLLSFIPRSGSSSA